MMATISFLVIEFRLYSLSSILFQVIFIGVAITAIASLIEDFPTTAIASLIGDFPLLSFFFPSRLFYDDHLLGDLPLWMAILNFMPWARVANLFKVQGGIP